MKILFAGGGTGGHFYPIIAVAEAVNAIAEKERLVGIKLFFMSDSPIDRDVLFKTGLSYIEIKTGKQRTYRSIENFFDMFRTAFACMTAVWKVFLLYPDVVFGKGGYASFPALFAARLLRIPVVIHESDIVPGKVNRWIGDYATKIAVSYPEATRHFKNTERIALTGQPVRKDLLVPVSGDPDQTFGLETGVPLILVLGGSQGAERINENLIDILPKIVEKYQVIHQTGEANLEWMKKRAAGALGGNPHASRYKPYGFLDVKALRLAAQRSALVISRAGSTIFEIALWKKPSVLIPLPIARDDHQRKNAYSYARSGAATVIEEQNLKPELFYSVIESIISDPAKQEAMIQGTKDFAKLDAAEKIAQVLLAIASRHD